LEFIEYEKKIFFDKTVCILEETKQNIDGKEYLFNNQFTAADLTLTSLIYPLRFVPPLFIKYKSIFEYCDQIREHHNPKKRQISNVEHILHRQREKRESLQEQSTIRNIIWNIFNILFYPLQVFF
jgi:glutathione S-transferase